MQLRRGVAWQVALFVLCLVPLAMLPFTVRYWPAEDNANQLALAHIVAHYHDPDAPWSRWFDLRWLPKPYILHTYVLVLLGRFMDLALADKIVISFATVVQPLSSVWLAHRLAPGRWSNAFLLLPLTASSYLLNRGFTPFILGLSAANVAVAVFVGGARSGQGRWLALGGLLLVTSLLHPYATVLAVALIASWCVAERKTALLKSLALALLPSAALYLANVWAVSHGPWTLPQPPPLCVAPFICPRIRTEWNPLALVTTLVSFSWPELLIRGAALALLAAGVILEYRSREGEATLRRLFAMWMVLYLVMPFGVAQRALHLPERVLAVLYVVAAATARLPRWLPSRAPPVLATVLCLALAAQQYRAAARENPNIDRIVRIGRTVPRGAKVAYLNHDIRGRMAVAQPEQFAWGYVLIERDIVTPDLFADGVTAAWGGVGYRPLVFRHPEELPWVDIATPYAELVTQARSYDFLLVVRAPRERLELLQRDFQVVSHEEDVWLFRGR